MKRSHNKGHHPPASFVSYATEYRLSSIRYVIPDQQHRSEEQHILARRNAFYVAARSRRPDWWTRRTRNLPAFR